MRLYFDFEEQAQTRVTEILDLNKEFFIILPDKLGDGNDKYVEGLNVDESFDPSCVYPYTGLIFTDIHYIYACLRKGPLIAEVEIPADAITRQQDIYCKASKIIIKNIRPWKDVLDLERAVTISCHNLQYIDKQTPTLHKIAISQTPFALHYLKDPSESLVLEVIKEHPTYIQHVTNQTDAMKWYIINNYSTYAYMLKDLTEEMKLVAVKLEPHVLRYMKDTSEGVQLAAVQRNGTVIKYIAQPSNIIQIAAVQQNGYAIQYIIDPTEEAKLAAVQQNGYAIRYIDNPSNEIQQIATKHTRFLSNLIPNLIPNFLYRIFGYDN
jgi:hypothetical protein